MSVEIGHRLRQAREAQGYSLEEMEQYTRISAQDLSFLEAGDFSRLSSPYYVRAYLRTYANTLGLNSRELLNDYRLRSRGTDGGAYPGSEVAEGRSRMSHRRSSSSLQGRGSAKEEEVAESPSLSRTSRYSRRHRAQSEGLDGRAAAGFEEEAGVVNTAGDELSRGTPRRVSMPSDLPEPEELGLPPKQRETPTQTPSQPPLSRSSTLGSRARGKRKERRTTKKSEESSLGTWYNRFLILMAVLLIPASIYVYFKITGDDVEKAASEPRKEEKQSGGQDPAKEKAPHPVLVPMESEGGEIDRYELTNADQIELKFHSKGECWFQIREQEVGGQLEDRVLKKGDTYSYPYKKGKELYLQLGRPSAVEVTVNGNKLKTSYEKGKVFHISLVK